MCINKTNQRCTCNHILSCECSPKYYIPMRWLNAILGMCVIIVIYCMRISMHIAIVRMVKNTTKAVSNSNCSAPNFTIRSDNVKHGTHDWSQSTQAWIIASFYYGYFPFNFLAGVLSDKYGSRWILSTGVLVSVICCCLIPISAELFGYLPVIVLRILQGCGQGVVFPALSSTLGRWVLPQERTTLAAITYSGISTGSVLGILVTALLMEAFNGWKIVFYFWAGMGLLMYFIIVLYLYSNPNTHPHLTERERKHIIEHMVRRFNTGIPYKKIMKDGAIIATVFGQVGYVIVLYFFISYLPKFMDNVMRYPITDNALISSFPYVGALIVSVAAGKFADWGIFQKNWDVGFVRKMYTILANIGASGCILAIGYSDCDHTFVIIFCFLAVTLSGFHNAGLKINTLDLTNYYAGFAMTLPNSVGCVIGALVPTMCGYLAPDNTLDQWCFIFWIMFIISVVSTLLYVVMGSGKRRRWDYTDHEQAIFKGKVSCFSFCDGIDKDKEAIEAIEAAEAAGLEN